MSIVGGTRLTLNASFALTIATELRCRFGHAAGGSVLATVAATSCLPRRMA